MTDIDKESPASGERTRSDQPGGTSIDPARAGTGPRPEGTTPSGAPGRKPEPARAERVPGGDMSDVGNLEDQQEPHATD